LALKWIALESDEREHCWFSETPNLLHPTIKKLAEKYSEHLEPLKSLHFATAGAFPYSVELTRTLDLLQQAGMIKRENPSFARFAPTWSADSEDIIKSIIDKEFQGQVNALKAFKNFAKDLKELKT
jgi:hypothetical protein